MKKTLSRFLPLFAALIAAAAALFLFRAALAPGHTLLSPDSQPYLFASWLDYAFVNLFGGRWEVPTFDTPLYWLLPLNVASTLSYVLSTALLALGTALYLHHWKCPHAAALLGALALAFSGYHFTLFSAGHRGYFIMMVYAVFLLSAIDGMVETGRWPYFVFAAVCAVSALRGQPDIFAIWCGVLALYALLRLVVRIRVMPRDERPRIFTRWIIGAAIGAATLLLFGYPTIRYTLTDVVAGREAQIADSARNSESAETTAESTDDTTRWDFATSWSLPPAELPELACANLRGYDSGNSNGPYWGSIGRNVHYGETKQGFFNFRQHTIYLGAIPLLFALFAAMSVLRRPADAKEPPETGFSPREARLVIAFWAIVAIGSLVLALGRYTPAYRLFYSLPMMSGIRGPIKFLHFTETSVAILSGFGFTRLLNGDGRLSARIAGLVGIAAMLLLLASTLRDPAGLDGAFTAMDIPEDSAPMLRTLLVGIRVKTLLLSALFFGLGAVAFLIQPLWKSLPAWVALFLVAASLCDSMRATAPYVNPVDVHTLIPSNTLVESLRKTGQLEASTWAGSIDPLSSYTPFRYSFECDEFLYADPGSWQSPDSMPILAARHFRPEDVLRRWQFLGTRLVLVPMEQYNAMPQDSLQFIKLGAYAFTRSGIVSVPADKAQFGALVLRNWIANGSIFTRWEEAPDDEAAWSMLADPSFDLSRKLVVKAPAPKCPQATGLTPPAAKTKTAVGEATGRHRRLVFETAEDSPEGLLLIRNQFGGLKEITASVDGNPVDILRANVLFRAVPVPAGRHTVEFRLPLHGRVAVAYGATALLLAAAAFSVLKTKHT